LGDYPRKVFFDDAALAAIEKFRAHLGKVSTKIEERNAKAERNNSGKSAIVVYKTLNPKQVPNSISI